MKVKTENGFVISRSGIATQLVINCHGGWIEKDGFTRVPKGLTLMFYTTHGDFTLGYKVVEAVKEKPKEAKVGLKKEISQSRTDEIGDKILTQANKKKSELSKAFGIPESSFDVLMKSDPAVFDGKLDKLVKDHNTVATNKQIPPYALIDMRNNLNVQKTLQEALQKELHNTCGLTDSFGGGNVMYNYCLAKETDLERKRACDSVWDKHRTGQDYDPDVDLLQMKTDNPRHLSDVFKIIAGLGYGHVHFGACRVPYGSTPTDVVTS